MVDSQEVIRRYLEGESVLSISKRFKIARGTVYRIIDEAGVRQVRNKPVDPEVADKARALFAKHKDPIGIGVTLGVPAWWVRYVCRRKRVPL